MMTNKQVLFWIKNTLRFTDVEWDNYWEFSVKTNTLTQLQVDEISRVCSGNKFFYNIYCDGGVMYLYLKMM